MSLVIRGLFCTGTLLAVAPLTVQAHLVSTRFGDFYGGMLHPLSALEHALPWLAVGLLAGFQGARFGRWILLAFPVGLLLGLILSEIMGPWQAVGSLNLASFIVMGTLLAAAWPLPLGLLLALAAVFGVSHGYGNGLAMTTQTNTALFIGGVVIVGHILVAVVAATTVVLLQRQRWLNIAVRAAGSWIAAVGIMLVGLELVAR